MQKQLIITFLVDFCYIYGEYYIYGCYYICWWYTFTPKGTKLVFELVLKNK